MSKAQQEEIRVAARLLVVKEQRRRRAILEQRLAHEPIPTWAEFVETAHARYLRGDADLLRFIYVCQDLGDMRKSGGMWAVLPWPPVDVAAVRARKDRDRSDFVDLVGVDSVYVPPLEDLPMDVTLRRLVRCTEAAPFAYSPLK